MAAADPLGNATSEHLGNGLANAKLIDLATGKLEALQTFVPGGAVKLTQTFAFDRVGNLTARGLTAPDANAPGGQRQVSESFGYDGIYRLKTVDRTVNAVADPQKTQAYDLAGNLTTRDELATGMDFDLQTKPHAIQSATVNGQGRDYHYDLNGNLATVTLTAGGAVSRSVCWQSSNHPTLIVAGSIDCADPDLAGKVFASFSYAPDRSRYKQVAGTGSTVTTTVYAGGLFERETLPSGTVRNIHYIRGPGRVVAEFTRTVDGQGATSDLTEYWHRDHLGSVVLRTDGSGNATDPCEYDAWGLKLACSGEKRGYTGHEHLGSLGLIHMNGRVYDPELGRFLSPDPFVQFPESTQGYNRYAYVGNNPLSRSDPSGHFEVAPQQVAAIAITAFTGGMGAGWAIGGGAAAGYIGSGGQGAFLGALSGMFSFGIGQAFQRANTVTTTYAGGLSVTYTLPLSTGQVIAKAALHGVVQGALSDAGGGRFGDGFVGGFSGGLMELPVVADAMAGLSGPSQVIVSAMVGGTISQISGGNFYNGALSAAMVHAFNALNSGSYSEAKTGCRQISCSDAEVVARQLTPAQAEAVATAFDIAADAFTAFDLANTAFGAVGPDGIFVAGGLRALANNLRVNAARWASSAPNAVKFEHIFSRDHIKRGILELGDSPDAIVAQARDTILSASQRGALKPGDNFIYTTMNGRAATVTARLEAGQLTSMNINVGVRAANSGKINVVDLR